MHAIVPAAAATTTLMLVLASLPATPQATPTVLAPPAAVITRGYKRNTAARVAVLVATQTSAMENVKEVPAATTAARNGVLALAASRHRRQRCRRRSPILR